jgi:hydrogenase expression/formation protein HypE
VVTKGAAIEATALFAATFPDRLRAAVGEERVTAADALFESMTVVPEAVLARSFGLREAGVTSMHDATEGGVVGGLLEVATASDVGIRIDRDLIPVRPEVRAVCEHVGIDPYVAISEGTLIATVVAGRAKGFVDALTSAGIDAAVVGEIRDADEGRTIVVDGHEQPLQHPGLDPFWAAFGAWAAEAASGN